MGTLHRPVALKKKEGVPKWAVFAGIATVIGGTVFFFLKK
jgi:hypothetical protein